MPETLADVLARNRHERDRTMLERARHGLQDLRAATWTAHHDLGAMTEAEHFEVAHAYSTIEHALDKLTALPEYALAGKP